MTENGSSTQYSIRAVDRVCDLLDALKGAPEGVSLSDLAKLAEMPKSSTLRYLAALEARDFVLKDSHGGLFHLGLALQPERSQYYEELRRRSMPGLTLARDAFGETVNLGVLDGLDVRYIAVLESERSVRMMTAMGAKDHIFSTAIGKSVLAQLDPLRQSEIVSRLKLFPITEATIVTKKALVDDVRLTAERGYGLDDCENQADGRCVAVPVPGLAVPAAMSVSAPVTRLGREDVVAIAARLKRFASALGNELRHIRA